MTVFIALWSVWSSEASACPNEVASSFAALEEAQAARKAAFEQVHGTDWSYELAIGDRDAVLARQKQATQALRDARKSSTSARRALADVRRDLAADERVCAPSEIEAAKATLLPSAVGPAL